MKFPHIRESSHKNIFVWSVERLLYRWNVWMNTRHWFTKLTPLCTIARYARSPLKTKEYTKLTLRAITWTYPALCATRNFVQDGLWIITTRRSMRTPPLTHLTSSIRITSLTSSCFWHLLFCLLWNWPLTPDLTNCGANKYDSILIAWVCCAYGNVLPLRNRVCG